ncbi:MAG: tol-pal system protein, partial [Planktomarina temperata]|nr:tol-pal system protein [Planktomarina temperata]
MHLGRALILIAGLSGPASADSLADMRQDLAGLLYETKRLRLELTAAQKGGFTNDGALLDRTAAIENELQRLTGQTEELAYRIS